MGQCALVSGLSAYLAGGLSPSLQRQPAWPLDQHRGRMRGLSRITYRNDCIAFDVILDTLPRDSLAESY